jgi:phospholipid-translocating ATPase
LVKFAEEMGMMLVYRDEQYIKLKNPNGEIEEYDILQNFPFKSETKRMGIIMRHRQSQKLMFYVKGADVAMIPKVKPGQRDACQEYCENLAMEGLRTLVITHKLISESQYAQFEKNLKQAKASMQNREE